MNFKNNIYKFIELEKDWKILFKLICFTIIEGCVPCVSAILIGRSFGVLTKAADGHYKTEQAMFHDLTVRTMLLMACAAGSFPICWLNINNWMQFGEKQGMRIRKTLLERYLDKSMDWFDSQDNLLGSFTQTNRCVEELRSSAAEASGITLQNVVTCCGLIGVSFYYSWSLTLIFLCSSPLIILCCAISAKKMEYYTNLENNETKLASDSLLWSMENIRLVKGFQGEMIEYLKFSKLADYCNKYFVKEIIFTSVNESVVRVLSLIMFVQGFWFGNHQIKKEKMTTTEVMICFTCCITLAATLMNTLQQIIIMQKGKVALLYINKIYDDSKEQSLTLGDKENHHQTTSCGKAFSEISLENVSFSYNSRPKDIVLKNVSLKFEANKTTYIIGKSGSGKSTVTSLLLKLYDNYTGKISVEKIDIREIQNVDMYSNITLIEQNCTLFSGSIRKNLLMGVNENDVSETFLEYVCRLCLLDEFICQLPQGLDTIIGKNHKDGVQLSGGQQQRLAIARAIICDRPVWIMDEALSALDTYQKDLIMKNLKNLRKGKTNIILTHDLSHLEEDNYIYYMDHGEIKEQGFKKNLLMNDSSIFKKMYTLQQNNQDGEITPVNDIHFPVNCSIPDAESEKLMNNNSSNQSVETEQLEDENDNVDEQKNVWNRIRNSLLVTSQTKETETNQSSIFESNRDLENSPKLTESSDIEERIPLMPLLQVFSNLSKTLNKKKLFAVGLISSILASASNPVFSYCFSKLLSATVKDTTHKSDSNSYLLKWSMIVISISLADGVFTLIKSFLLKYVAEYWIFDLRILSVKKILEQDMVWFQDSLNKPSEIAALVSNDLRDLRSLASEFINVLVSLVFVSLIGLIWAIVTGWKLSLVCLSLIPLYLICSVIYGVVLQNAENKYKSCIADLENKQYEIISNIKTIRLLQLETKFVDQFEQLTLSLNKAMKYRSRATGFGVSLFKSITFCVQSILLYYGLKLVCKGDYSTEKMFQTFTLLIFTVITCSALSTNVPDMARGQRAATYIFHVINSPKYHSQENQLTIPTNSKEEKVSETVIEFENFQFHYPNAVHNQIFNDLSFKINKNEVVGIVGKSGCGKSTIASILTLLYPVMGINTVKVKDQDINAHGVSNIRKLINVVEQKPAFFKDTIKNNLLYGDRSEKISDLQIWHILEALNLKRFVESLPNGLETVVDTSLMSGGQAQRLSLARSILRKPEILVLDECTSALDATNASIIENFVTSKTEETLFGTTRIIITHSKTLMQKCDRLIVLNDKSGNVETIDSYDNLLKSNNSYFSQMINESF